MSVCRNRAARNVLLIVLAVLFLIDPAAIHLPVQPTQTLGDRRTTSILPQLRKQTEHTLLGDLQAAINRALTWVSRGAIRYYDYLPSNIPNVYASNTFGITTTGSTSYPTHTDSVGAKTSHSTVPNDLFFVPITASGSGALVSVGLDIQAVGAGGNIQTALYSAYNPNTHIYSGLLGYSSSTPATVGWNDLPVTSSTSIVSGTTYYAAFLTDNSQVTRYYTTATDTDRFVSFTYGSFPSSSSATGSGGATDSLRITYSETVGYTQGTQVDYTDTTCSSCVSSFSFYVSAYSSGDKIVLALYSDSSGSPSQELWNSNTSGTDPGATGWATINESSGTVDNSWNAGLTNGSFYWLMWQWNSVDNGPSFCDGLGSDCAVGASNSGIHLAQAFGILSSSWSGGTENTDNWSMYLTYSATSTATTSTTAATTTTATAATTAATTTTTATTANGAIPTCTYEVFISSGTTTAQNCGTGVILDQSTNAAEVINDAIDGVTSGGKIFIKAGTYTFTTTPIDLGNGNFAAIGTTSVSGIELYGEGSGTILNAGTNMNGAVIGVLNANNWYIHDLQVNGNRASQSGSGGSPPYLNGIWIINSPNTVIEHCYVHDTKTVGIYVVSGSSDALLYNDVVNNNANGIQVGAGFDQLIQGNIVNGASDVGISISGSGGTVSNVLCTGNIVSGISLGVSPFGVNSAVGIYVGDTGPATNVTVSSNQLYGGGSGIYSGTPSGSNVDVTIFGNEIHSTKTYGISVDTTTSASVEDNLLDNTQYMGIRIYAVDTDVVVSGNRIQSPSNSYGIYMLASNGLINGNQMDGGTIYSSGAYTNISDNTVVTTASGGIFLDTGSDDSSVVGNTLYVNPSSNKYGIYVDSKDLTITNNRVSGATWGAGIVVDSGASGAFVVGNNVRNDTYSISGAGYSQSPIKATGVIVEDNAGYNPIGIVANFVTGNSISPTGTSSTPAKSTTYTVAQTPCLITFITVGSGVSFSINGGSGFAVTTGESFQLYPGETVNFGAFSTAPTIQLTFS